MKERGIIMSGDNPKLILENRKNLTRRLQGLDAINKNPDDWRLDGVLPDGRFVFRHTFDKRAEPKPTDVVSIAISCPYGVAGDRLWVRETWAAPTCYDDEKPRDLPDTLAESDEIIYRAESPGYRVKELGSFWRSPYHMPRWASRITLEITKVRVERLQDISEEDAKAEGVIPRHPDQTPRNIDGNEGFVESYAALWNSLHGKGAWDANPWVWVIEFRLSPKESSTATLTTKESN